MNPRAESRAVSGVLWRILGLNLLVAAAKIVYGSVSGAIAVTADGFHSLLDGSSNVIGLVGTHLAGRPPDSDHPYGHRKFEAFAALGIAVLLLLACARIAATALERLRVPHHPDIQPVGFAILGATILINVLVARYERKAGDRLRSEVLLADAGHTRSDVWSSLLVIASFAAVKRGYVWADVAAALVIVGVIAGAGFGIVRRAFRTLSDTSRVSPAEIEALALGVEGVLECHEVRSRGAAGDIQMDLHVLVDPRMPIAEAHRIGHQVEAAVRAAYPDVADVVVHVEPALESERLRTRSRG